MLTRTTLIRWWLNGAVNLVRTGNGRVAASVENKIDWCPNLENQFRYSSIIIHSRSFHTTAHWRAEYFTFGFITTALIRYHLHVTSDHKSKATICKSQHLAEKVQLLFSRKRNGRIVFDYKIALYLHPKRNKFQRHCSIIRKHLKLFTWQYQ